MNDSACDAQIFVEGMSKQDFLNDKRTRQATIMSLLIIGEAATKVMAKYSDDLSAFPQIEWRSMRGMRNRIAHGYADINLELVWDTVQTELTELRRSLDEIMQDLPSS